MSMYLVAHYTQRHAAFTKKKKKTQPATQAPNTKYDSSSGAKAVAIDKNVGELLRGLVSYRLQYYSVSHHARVQPNQTVDVVVDVLGLGTRVQIGPSFSFARGGRQVSTPINTWHQVPDSFAATRIDRKRIGRFCLQAVGVDFRDCFELLVNTIR